jgi:hypothetical protein
MKKIIIFASAVFVAGGITYLSFQSQSANEIASAGSFGSGNMAPEIGQNGAIKQAAIPEVLKKKGNMAPDALVEQLSRKMRAQFADSINSIVVQVSLKDMRVGLESEFPGQGSQMFEEILRRAFPELADQILLAIANMDAYDEWLVDSYLDLNDMNAVAKDNTVWNKRIELFGEEDARLIWNEEIAQDQQRERNVKTVMTELNTAYDMPLEDRVYTMQVAMQDNYGDTPEGLLMGTASVTTQMVFRLDSVQKELAAMEAGERQETINQMRLQLGFPEDRIGVLAEQDKKNDEMWDKGNAYMEEREALVATYQGEDLETELDLLRLKHFDDRSAYSLKQEEALGMMRYERQRIYGLN